MSTADPTGIRLQLLANGFTPLPNVAKGCYLAGWPRLAVNRHMIRKWRRLLRYSDTGIRLDNGLAVIDIDIDDVAAVGAILKQLAALLPGALRLVRHGNGAKVAIFVRTDEEFGRICSYSWTKPGETEDEGAYRVEIFGGGSARQFGAFGSCGPGKSYRWAGRSPLDSRLDQLPFVTKKQFFSAVDIAEKVLRELGWGQMLRSKRGENVSRPVRDLTPDMVFNCNDGVTRTLSELTELARSGGLPGGLECSASWLEGPSAKRTDRCLIGATADGSLTVWETSSDVTHMSKPVEIDVVEAAKKIRRAKELFNVRA
ncbi:hypothetical protein [Mesorhizobium sp. KR9-304]|uniref:hypothetical protein n=1 Tax=Mesorhizobium sp. KR9-304 TaxID=3156614 RepID=UPI0032B42CB7